MDTRVVVAEEDVVDIVGVAGGEVGGGGAENEGVAVGAHAHASGGAVGPLAAGGDRDADRLAGAQVGAEGVGDAVGVAGDQVGGVGHERDIPSVVGDGREVAGPVALRAVDSA